MNLSAKAFQGTRAGQRGSARADLLDSKYESAIKSLRRTLEAQPDTPALRTDMASAYFERAEAARIGAPLSRKN